MSIKRKPTTCGLACALISGKVGLADFESDALMRPDVVRLAERVTPIVDEDFERRFGRNVTPARVEAVIGAKVYSAQVLQALGGVDNPMSPQVMRRKLEDCLSFGGFDAGHKITLLAALAFGCAPNFAAAQIEGISQVELSDIRLAHDLGHRIKLIAQAVRDQDGVSVRVRPSLVPLDHPLAQAGGALNALFIEGARTGRIFVQGPGAGAGPTAAAVDVDASVGVGQRNRGSLRLAGRFRRLRRRLAAFFG